MLSLDALWKVPFPLPTLTHRQTMSVTDRDELTFFKPSETIGMTELPKGAGVVSYSEGSLAQETMNPWNGDPANPRNWRSGKKWAITAIVNEKKSFTLLSFLTVFRSLHTTSSHHWRLQ